MQRTKKQTGADKQTEITDITREDRIMKRIFLSPAIIVLLALSIFPLFWSLGISFTDMLRGGSTTAREAEMSETASEGFLGMNFSITLRNYDRLLDDQRLHTAARNTMYYVFVGVTVQYILGIGLALVLNQNFVGRKVVRVIFLMPMMTMPVVVAYVGRMMFDSYRSPIADLWRHIVEWWVDVPLVGSHLNPIIPWLTDGRWARASIVLMDSWQWIPFVTLILLAGMQAIPDDIYEAARVDGASSWQMFWRITFPILLPLSVTVVLIRGLEIFKIIDVIVVTTGGGPGSATESLTMYIYKTALTFGNYGYAAAISFVLLVLVIIFATVFLALGRRAAPRAV
ncbi:MAG: sugar ABC transporter permease [Anaerolineae bacterium]|nr:sugar ABC transporter permease [Anaerolineae bacterium]